MKFQTVQDRVREAFNGLGGCWVLVETEYSIHTYQNTLNDDLLYVFKHEYIRGYGNKKYGMIV